MDCKINRTAAAGGQPCGQDEFSLKQKLGRKNSCGYTSMEQTIYMENFAGNKIKATIPEIVTEHQAHPFEDKDGICRGTQARPWNHQLVKWFHGECNMELLADTLYS